VFTIWRHDAARFLGAFAAAFAILALLLVAVDAMLHLASLFEQAATPSAALRLLLERALAGYAAFLTPICAFVAAFWCAGTATLARETLALKASGISPRTAFAPLLVLAGALGAVHAVSLEEAAVRAAAAVAARRNPGAGEVRVRAGDVWVHAGRVVYAGRRVDPRTGAVEAIRVYERNDAGHLVRTIAAARAERIAPQRWAFEDALVRVFDPSAPTAAPRELRGARLVLDLPADRTPLLRREELAGLSTRALRRAAETPGPSAGDARVALENRRSAPWAPPVFALVAVPLALRSEGRRSLARAALQGAALTVLFLTARDVGSSFAAGSPLLAAAFPWLTLAALGALGLALLARVRV
jgi:lipopolysaccharide export LptBFGC system permease protein LptF